MGEGCDMSEGCDMGEGCEPGKVDPGEADTRDGNMGEAMTWARR